MRGGFWGVGGEQLESGYGSSPTADRSRVPRAYKQLARRIACSPYSPTAASSRRGSDRRGDMVSEHLLAKGLFMDELDPLSISKSSAEMSLCLLIDRDFRTPARRISATDSDSSAPGDAARRAPRAMGLLARAMAERAGRRPMTGRARLAGAVMGIGLSAMFARRPEADVVPDRRGVAPGGGFRH